MAENPAIIACPANTWVKVADSVLVGTLYRMSAIPNTYAQVIRVAGDPAPTDNSEMAQIFDDCNSSVISSDSAIDVYVKALRSDGAVRADL